MDISSLAVPGAKFQEAKSDYLGQLIVTPEMVAKKIKVLKDNKSPGVDGIPPRQPMESVGQISIPRVFNLKEGVIKRGFLLNGKKQTSYHYLKRVLQTSELSSVICK